MSLQGIAMITSRHWEGAYVLKELIRANLPCADVLVHPRWWGPELDRHLYTPTYLAIRDTERKGEAEEGRTYFTLEELAQISPIRLHQLDAVNSEGTRQLLLARDPRIIVVVGAPILKPPLVKAFPNRIINFHTGVLPEYRGPYSEFWAFYEGARDAIGTTIHLIDEGIDTGPVLAIRRISADGLTDPFEAHVANTKAGARSLPEVLKDYIGGRITPQEQDRSRGRYRRAPTERVIQELRQRLQKHFIHRFAE